MQECVLIDGVCLCAGAGEGICELRAYICVCQCCLFFFFFFFTSGERPVFWA